MPRLRVRILSLERGKDKKNLTKASLSVRALCFVHQRGRT
jgi:hypothetical protein